LLSAINRHPQPAAPQPPRPGPHLIPPRPQHRSPLALWHLLSLDAPTVAALWTLFIARISHISLPWPEPAAMFVAVWIIYAADRLLDARLLDARQLDTRPNATELEPRHHFHHHHRNRFLTAIALAALILVYLLICIDPRSLHLYALLATLLAAWMLLIHARPHSHRLPKELAVGLFFPAAIFIPTVARDPAIRLDLLPTAILFAFACTLNCLYLYVWEHTAPTPIAHITTRWATSHLIQLATTLLIFATLIFATRPSITNLPALACAITAAALITLNAHRHRLSPIHLRAAADLTLLTPILLLPFAR